MKKLFKSKLARRIARGKKKGRSQIPDHTPEPTGAKDLARAIFAVADQRLETKTAKRKKS